MLVKINNNYINLFQSILIQLMCQNVFYIYTKKECQYKGQGQLQTDRHQLDLVMFSDTL